MITITYIDGSTDEFKSTKFVFTEDNDEWLNIKENTNDPDGDDYDDSDDILIAEIQRSQIRKLQYD